MLPAHTKRTLLVLWLLSAAVTAAEDKITYDEHIQPILRQKCFACHNPDKRSGDLDLTNYTGLMQGGGSGEVVEPGDSSASYLFMLITHEEEPSMPPDSPKLAEEILTTVRHWIDGGALENASSKTVVAKKPGKTFMAAAAGERPSQVTFPGRLSLEPVIHTAQQNAVTAIATSPWAPLVAVGGQRQVLLFRTRPSELLGVLPYPEGEIHALTFSRDGSLLLAGGGQGAAEGKVVVWDVRRGERILKIGDELDTVLSTDIRRDFRQVALGGPGRVVRVFSTETGKVQFELRKHTEWIQALSFSPDGVLLATADRNGGLFIWEAHTGREYLALKGHGTSITAVSWRGDSNVLASCSEDGSIRLWEMENGSQVKNWGAHSGGVASIEFTRDGRLVSCGRDRIVKLWDAAGTELRAFDAFQDLALQITFCNETNCVIAGDWNGEMRVWDAAEGKLVGQLDFNPPQLSDRVKFARAEVTQQSQITQQATTNANSATAAHQEGLRKIQQAEQLLTELGKQLVTNQQTIADSEQQIEEMKVSTDQATATINLLTPALPDLQEAATRARTAANLLPDDSELAMQATTLENITQRRTIELNQATKTQSTTARLLSEKQQLCATAQNESKRLTTERDTADQQHKELQEQLITLQQILASRQQELSEAQQELDRVNHKLTRWQEEVQFAAQLYELRQARSDALARWLDSQSKHAALTAAVDTTQQVVEQTEQSSREIAATMGQLREQIAHAETNKQTYLQQVEKLTKEQASTLQMTTRQQRVLALLQTSLESVQQALTLTPNDETLTNSQEQLQTASAQHTQRLTDLHTTYEHLEQSLQTTQTDLEQNKQRASELAEALQLAQQNASTLMSQLDTERDQLQQAQLAASETFQTTELLLTSLKQARRQVLIAQGLEQPDASTQANAAVAN